MPTVKLDARVFFASILLLVLLGEAEALSFAQIDARIFLVALLLLSSILAFLYFRGRATAPIEVLSLAYDKEKHRMELTVRNRNSKQYCMKSALRLVQSPEQYVKETSDGKIPMAAARMSTMDRKFYQLLCEDDDTVVINPSETRVLYYDVVIPKGDLNLNPEHNVEVSISYGEDKTRLGPAVPVPVENAAPQVEAKVKPAEVEVGATLKVPEEKPAVQEQKEIEAPQAFAAAAEAKTQVEQMIEQTLQTEAAMEKAEATAPKAEPEVTAEELASPDEIYLLEDLLDATIKAPAESIGIHMKDQNDFSLWVSKVINNAELAGKLNDIGFTTPEETKEKLVGVIGGHIGSLKQHYLRRVSEDKSFVMKTGHESVVGSVFHIEELLETVKKAPEDSIRFHTRNGNDFSVWVGDAIGDKKLAEELARIDYTKGEAKKALEEKLEARIRELKE